jgi:hypothetical protein
MSMLGATERFWGGVSVYQLLLLFLPPSYIASATRNFLAALQLFDFLEQLINISLNLAS